MSKHLASMILVMLLFGGKAFAADYRVYHQQIIQAEDLIFVQQQFDAGLDLYRKTFKQYDFVFASDCVTAMEIALFRNNKDAFMEIATKSFANGVLPRHLKGIRYINTNTIYTQYRDSLIRIFRKQRPHYLARIRPQLPQLKRITELYAHDQLVKNDGNGESAVNAEKRYKQQIAEKFKELKAMLLQYGFLSDQLIGIGQNDIMMELGNPGIDLPDFYIGYKKYPEYRMKSDFFELDEYNFCSYLSLVMLVHYEHRFGYPKLFDSSFYADQIAKGNLHPKEFGKLVDWRFNSSLEKQDPDLTKGDFYFGLGISVTPPPQMETIPKRLPDQEIDRLRKKYLMAPIESDRKKWRFMMGHGMYIGWGLTGSRS